MKIGTKSMHQKNHDSKMEARNIS